MQHKHHHKFPSHLRVLNRHKDWRQYYATCQIHSWQIHASKDARPEAKWHAPTNGLTGSQFHPGLPSHSSYATSSITPPLPPIPPIKPTNPHSPHSSCKRKIESERENGRVCGREPWPLASAADASGRVGRDVSRRHHVPHDDCQVAHDGQCPYPPLSLSLSDQYSEHVPSHQSVEFSSRCKEGPGAVAARLHCTCTKAPWTRSTPSAPRRA